MLRIKRLFIPCLSSSRIFISREPSFFARGKGSESYFVMITLTMDKYPYTCPNKRYKSFIQTLIK